MNTYANGTAALQFPSNYVLMSEDEMTYVDGGGTVTLKLGISFTVGGMVAGLAGGIIAGMVNAATGGMGGFIAWAGIQLISDSLAGFLNGILPHGGGVYSKTVNWSKTSALLPDKTFTYYFDIGSLIGQGGGRGLASGATIRLNGRQVCTVRC